MDSRARELVRIGDTLFAKKLPWDSLCQEIAENFYPLRANFIASWSLGYDFATGIMDSFPVLACRLLGDAPSAMLRQGDWFKVRTTNDEINEDPTNARWLEYATKRFRNHIYDRRTNFLRATNEADLDWVAFGNPILSVEEAPSRDHFLFRAWHPKDCAWMENGIGKIDHNQRKIKMTARGIMNRREWAKNAHPEIKQAYQRDPGSEFNLRHIMLPMDEIYGDDKAKRRQYRDMPFVSLYVDADHQTILSERGSPVFNYVIPRWRTLSDWPQGFSPASITSLPDGRMLQTLARIMIEQGEKAVDPPLYGKGDIFRDGLNRYAGGFTTLDLEGDQDIREAMMFEDAKTGMGVGRDMQADVRNLISESFLLNKLMLPSERAMTAFETEQRVAEFRRAVLPFFGPIEHEYHLPLLDTAFQMAVRNDLFDIREMPEALSDAEVTFAFDSPLSSADGRKAVQAYQESIQILGAAVQFDQSAVSILDLKQATHDAIKGTGALADWFNDDEVQASEEEQQRTIAGLQQAAAMLQQGSMVAQDVAGASVALKEAGLT
ncbi:portal protein [Brucella sp. IR073]|uniref:portal protein n=1 Tax=unclassified Brucella TaxID=2632610 RepID=UPI003B983F4F